MAHLRCENVAAACLPKQWCASFVETVHSTSACEKEEQNRAAHRFCSNSVTFSKSHKTFFSSSSMRLARSPSACERGGLGGGPGAGSAGGDLRFRNIELWHAQST